MDIRLNELGAGESLKYYKFYMKSATPMFKLLGARAGMNSQNVLIQKVTYYCRSLKIRNLGPGTITKLVEHDLIGDPPEDLMNCLNDSLKY